MELMKTQERRSITKEGQNLVASDYRFVYNKAHVCEWQFIPKLKLCNLQISEQDPHVISLTRNGENYSYLLQDIPPFVHQIHEMV